MSSLASKKSSKRHSQGHSARYQGLEAQRSIWKWLLDHIAAFFFALWQAAGVIFQHDHVTPLGSPPSTESADPRDENSLEVLEDNNQALQDIYLFFRQAELFNETGSSHPCRCTVYIWTKPLIKYPCFASKPCTKKTRSPCVEHWMVAFEYEDEVLVCDAVEDNGELTGRCKCKAKNEFHHKYPEKTTLGYYEISKEFVKNTVEAIKNDGPYDVVCNNCQKWLKKLLYRLTVANPSLVTWKFLFCSTRAKKGSCYAED